MKERLDNQKKKDGEADAKVTGNVEEEEEIDEEFAEDEFSKDVNMDEGKNHHINETYCSISAVCVPMNKKKEVIKGRFDDICDTSNAPKTGDTSKSNKMEKENEKREKFKK